VPELINFWLAYRVELEKHACQYWIKERTKDIAYLQLMRLAISKLDVIIAHVKNKKLDDAGLVKAVSRDLKITDEQTNQILARNLRQLRHLEDEKLVEQIKNIEKEKASYEVRLKRPSAYIAKHLDELQSKIK
jgi:DNA gyrase/topoisomerase IV subunit A